MQAFLLPTTGPSARLINSHISIDVIRATLAKNGCVCVAGRGFLSTVRAIVIFTPSGILLGTSLDEMAYSNLTLHVFVTIRALTLVVHVVSECLCCFISS